jgi:hypothetical protein
VISLIGISKGPHVRDVLSRHETESSELVTRGNLYLNSFTFSLKQK